MGKRRLMMAVVAVVVLSSAAFAGGPLGPPAATQKQGKWAVDGAYFYEEMDLWGCGTWIERSRAWEDPNWGSWSIEDYGPDRLRLQDLQTNTWLGSIEYGLCDNWGVYVRAGASDAEADVVWWGESEKDSADFGYGLAWELGTNFTICQRGPWTFGGRMQIGAAYPDDWSETSSGSNEGGNWVGSANGELNYWQGLAYVGGLYQMDDAWQLYAGMGWQTLQGTLDVEYTETGYSGGDPDYQFNGSADMKLKHASAIGVFGVLWKPPVHNASVGAELIVGEAGKFGFGITGTIPIP